MSEFLLYSLQVALLISGLGISIFLPTALSLHFILKIISKLEKHFKKKREGYYGWTDSFIDFLF